MKQFNIFFLGFLFLCTGVVQSQTDGDLDTTFNALNDQFPATIGASGRIFSAVVQSDDKVIIGGQFTSYNGVSSNRIARLNEDGSLDPSFNVGAGANNTIQTMILLPEGKILIAGRFTSFNQTLRNGLARLNQDGSLDLSFDPSLGATSILSMAMQPDGKVLIGGQFTSYNGVPMGRVARINTDGSLDNTFNVGTAASEEAASINSIVVQENGKIYLGGRFTIFNELAHSRLVKLNSDGSVDNSFNIGTGPNNLIQTMALQTDGKIIVAGSFTSFNAINSRRLARINEDGSLDVTFSAGVGANGISTIGLQPDGKIMIAGRFTSFNGIPCGRILRLNNNGEVDIDFNNNVGANSNVLNVSLQSNQKWIIVGQFTSYNEVAQNYITQINTDGTLSPGFNAGTLIGANNRVNSLVVQQDGKSIIVGQFTAYNGLAANRIARVNMDGSNDESFLIGSGANNSILASKMQSDGKIILGGSFTNFNEMMSNRIVRLNSDGSIDTNFNVGSGANATISAIEIQHDGKIMIAGQFTAINEVERNGIARLNQDGSVDGSFDPGLGAIGITNIAMEAEGKILIGGSFTIYNGVPCGKLVRINTNGTLDNSFALGSGASEENAIINTIIVQLDGKILIGGRFTTFNETNQNRLFRLNSDGSFDNSFNIGNGANNTIQTMILQPDGKLIIAGSFTNFNGNQSRRIARINTDGTLDTAFNAGNGANGILTLGLQPDGKLILGGTFTSFNDINRNSIARIFNEIPLEISDDSCNTTIQSASNEYVYATNLQEAALYEFKIQSEGNIQFLSSPSNNFRFSDLGVGNFTYGTTYDVSVRAKSNGIFTAYSNACPITLTANPTTSMDGFCNQVMPVINSKIYFFLVPQATEYRYSITNVLTNEEQFVSTNKRFFYITDVMNYDFDTEYSIKCQVKIGGIFGDFGPACVLTTASAPTVKLRDQYCNATLSTLLENMYANILVGASSYKFKIENNGNEQEIERPDSRFSMGFATGIQPNTTYNISVAMFFNNAWQPYGEVCTITTPTNLPTSELRPQFCGGTLTAISSNFYATFRVGASAYRFKTTINGEDMVVERPDARCFMSAFAGATNNNTYEIQVAVKFNENWSTYGAVCTLTIGNVSNENNFKQNISENDTLLKIKAYPNPFENQITLSLSNENIKSDIKIYDMTGKLIQQVSTQDSTLQIGSKFTTGVYLIQIILGQETKNIRVVKQ